MSGVQQVSLLIVLGAGFVTVDEEGRHVTVEGARKNTNSVRTWDVSSTFPPDDLLLSKLGFAR